MSGVAGLCSGQISVIHLDGRLRVPVDHGLRHEVRARVRRGERCLLLDLAGVSTVDAAGVGELVRAYNMATAVNGFLRVVRPNDRVRAILERAGLAGLLTAEPAVA